MSGTTYAPIRGCIPQNGIPHFRGIPRYFFNPANIKLDLQDSAGFAGLRVRQFTINMRESRKRNDHERLSPLHSVRRPSVECRQAFV